MTAQEPDAQDDASGVPRRPSPGPAHPPVSPPGTRRDREGPRTGRPRAWSPRTWTLWGLPNHVLVFVLVLDAVAVAVTVVALLRQPGTAHDAVLTAVLVAGAAAHIEVARHIERAREATSGVAPYIDVKSLWSSAAVVLMPLGPAIGVAAFTFAWWWLRVSQRPPPHRWFFSFATVVVATAAASAVLSPAGGVDALFHGPAGLALLAAAVVVRWTVNSGLVALVISLTAPQTPWRRRFGSFGDTLVGVGALMLGVALAGLVHLTPWLVPVVLLPVVGMHRGILLPQFARAARTDAKTGLANAAHWSDLAAREVARMARRRAGTPALGVLIIDLDAFKQVNDRHGHLVGDAVLRAVADLLRTELRAYDVPGRFGGEEFVVLLPDTLLDEIASVGERLRRRIDELTVPARGGTVGGLSASIGAAAYPYHGRDVDDLLAAADTALYAAKQAGRNRVEIAAE